MAGALEGYRIVDVTQVISGPMATRILAEESRKLERAPTWMRTDADARGRAPGPAARGSARRRPTRHGLARARRSPELAREASSVKTVR